MTADLQGAAWCKSSRSGNSGGECVELALGASVAGVRDSKNSAGPVLTFGHTELAAFLSATKAGRFDG
ncbi:MAG TPA: DUF397 domain-containing protein [Pseudonocardiaceae bacterium]|jgi:hypothetical protein|nr:DUF397 domain-containing protein [Pseudonocardiaceae bacterium]